MNRFKAIRRIIIAGAALGAVAATISLAPVATKSSGSVAVAEDNGATAKTYSNDCSDVTWPNIPAECLKDASASQPARVIMIGGSDKKDRG